MLQQFAQAIRSHQLLRISYGGGDRVIEPHCCGYGSKGQELLRCYQASGFSRDNKPQGWKLIRVDEIDGCMPTGEMFSGTRPGYNPLGDKSIPQVVAKL